MIKKIVVCDQCGVSLPIKDFAEIKDPDIARFKQTQISIDPLESTSGAVIFLGEKNHVISKQIDFCSYACFHDYLIGNTK